MVAIEMTTDACQIAFAGNARVRSVVEQFLSGQHLRGKFFRRNDVCFADKSNQARSSGSQTADVKSGDAELEKIENKNAGSIGIDANALRRSGRFHCSEAVARRRIENAKLVVRLVNDVREIP